MVAFQIDSIVASDLFDAAMFLYWPLVVRQIEDTPDWLIVRLMLLLHRLSWVSVMLHSLLSIHWLNVLMPMKRQLLHMISKFFLHDQLVGDSHGSNRTKRKLKSIRFFVSIKIVNNMKETLYPYKNLCHR